MSMTDTPGAIISVSDDVGPAINMNPSLEAALAQLHPEILPYAEHALHLGDLAFATNMQNADRKREWNMKLRDERNRWATVVGEHKRTSYKIAAKDQQAHDSTEAYIKKQLAELDAATPIVPPVNAAELERFLKRTNTSRLVPIEPIKVPLDLTPDDAAAAVAKAKSELVAAEHLPRNADAAMPGLEKVLAEIEAAKPDFRRMLKPDDHDSAGNFQLSRSLGRVKWPTISVRVEIHGEATYVELPNFLGIVEYLQPGLLRERMTADLIEQAGGRGVSAVEKAERVAQAQANLVHALRVEHEVHMRLEKQNKFLRTSPVPLAVALAFEFDPAKIIRVL